jgi:glycosyltransferase involved in cell wall biosynthesis
VSGVAVVALGRATLGERRRIDSWRALFESLGVPVSVVNLVEDHRARPALPTPGLLRAIVQADAVPEAALWSAASARRALDVIRPDVVVCVTARAFRPELAGCAPRVVRDLVDPLSQSYRQRSRLDASAGRRLVYRVLARPSARFERRIAGRGIDLVAAGWQEAEVLGATWFPNLVGDEPPRPAQPDVDVVFFGTLSYPPNVDAVHALMDLWPGVLARRPGTTARIAGRGPSRALVDRARRLGWEVEADYPSVADLLARSRVAVAPLRVASGVQNKVLEAAAAGVPQVASPEALAGLDPEFPAEAAPVGPAMVDALVALLDDASRARGLAARAREHVEARYRPVAWQHLAHALLDPGATLRGGDPVAL